MCPDPGARRARRRCGVAATRELGAARGGGDGGGEVATASSREAGVEASGSPAYVEPEQVCLRITVFARGSPAYVQCPAPGRLWRLGAAGAPFYRNSASVVSAAGVFNCSVSAATPWHLGHRCIFGLRSSREALRRTCSVLHQVGCYGWAQPTLPSAGILGRR